MTTIIPVPSLGTEGWITDAAGKLDTLLAHFFLSDYNQSNLYKQTISSLPRIIQQAGNSMEIVISSIKTELEQYLVQYYDQVNLDVIGTNTTPGDLNTRLEIKINITIVDSGKVSDFSRLLRTNNSKMESIAALNNQG